MALRISSLYADDSVSGVTNHTITKNNAALVEILKPIWGPFSEKHGLHADYLLTGMYFDGMFTRQVGQRLIEVSAEGQINWHQTDVINMPGHEYFWRGRLNSSTRKISITSSPQDFLKSILPSRRDNDQAMIHVPAPHDSLPAILIIRGKYHGWSWQNKRHWYVMLLAFSVKPGGIEIQYQILDWTPKFLDKYRLMFLKCMGDKSLPYFPAGHTGHVPFVADPTRYPQPEASETVKVQSQSLKDSLYQWVMAGPHTLVTEDFYLETRKALDLPEDLYRQSHQGRENRLRAGVNPQRWQVVNAHYRTRPHWFGAEYYFTLQSRDNPDKRYLLEFYLFHAPEPGQFQGGKMRLRSFRQVEN
ncbi:MAG: hypothetical protein K9M19_06145 [Candidatus Marinimicrobia bacterium]|nr:hypothetical protein [Candidatus Neomarinimicrobiota bacterium]